MGDLNLRLAQRGDIERIKVFINTNWKRYNLINNEALFQFYFVRSETVNFVLAEDRDDGTLYGTLGYTYCGWREKPDLGTTLFKTVHSPYPLLGVRLFRALEELTGCRMFFSQNTVPNTAQLHRMMGHQVMEFPHWYRLAEREDYRIAVVREKKILPAKSSGYRLKLFPDENELFAHYTPPKDRIPYKDCEYLSRRYYHYPAYRYLVYGISKPDNCIEGIVVCREVPVEGERVLKVVDFVGEDLVFAELSGEFQRLIDIGGYEYIEMYQYGIPDQVMEEAGFIRRVKGDVNIVPTFLEPLAKINTDYVLCCSGEADGLHVFRADADMDRPNRED